MENGLIFLEIKVLQNCIQDILQEINQHHMLLFVDGDEFIISSQLASIKASLGFSLQNKRFL